MCSTIGIKGCVVSRCNWETSNLGGRGRLPPKPLQSFAPAPNAGPILGAKNCRSTLSGINFLNLKKSAKNSKSFPTCLSHLNTRLHLNIQTSKHHFNHFPPTKKNLQPDWLPQVPPGKPCSNPPVVAFLDGFFSRHHSAKTRWDLPHIKNSLRPWPQWCAIVVKKRRSWTLQGKNGEKQGVVSVVWKNQAFIAACKPWRNPPRILPCFHSSMPAPVFVTVGWKAVFWHCVVCISIHSN